MDGTFHRRGKNKQLNVLGGDLEPCRSSKHESEIVTGFYRDNCCILVRMIWDYTLFVVL